MPVDTCPLTPFEDCHARQFGSVARREYALLIGYGRQRSPPHSAAGGHNRFSGLNSGFAEPHR